MPCSTCYSADIQECPNYLAIDAGLSGNTQYRWQIKDKFGTVYRGLTTTDEPGIMYIPAMESEVFPPGLFMHFSGAFTLTAFENTTGSTYVPATFTIEETPYDCITLNVVKYVGEVDDDSPVTTPTAATAPFLEIHITPEMAGVNHVTVADLNNKKYRLERVGAGTLPRSAWTYKTGGGWTFTDTTDLVQANETFYAYFITAEPEVV